MRMRVKICGVTSREAIAAAVHHGADAVGFVFAESPRRVTVETASVLARHLPPFVARVAVFRHPRPDEVERVVNRLRPHVVQAEGDAAVEAVVPDGTAWLPVLHDHQALVTEAVEYLERSHTHARAVLLEAAGRGGRGIAPSWDRAADLARRIPLVLAGGLTPENVGDAIRLIRPFAVDVSSGVESSPGRKDPERIAAFLSAVRRAERETWPVSEVAT